VFASFGVRILWNFYEHTAQSAAVTAKERRETDENVKRGSELMMAVKECRWRFGEGCGGWR
jgi:hypothetical protein